MARGGHGTKERLRRGRGKEMEKDGIKETKGAGTVATR
jgi:hypothetical protein